MLPGTKLDSIKINTFTYSSSIKSQLKYKGTIKINIDATEFLLIQKNQYRKSEAIKLASKQLKAIIEKIPGSSPGGYTVSISVDLYIKYKGENNLVTSLDESIRIKNFPGII